MSKPTYAQLLAHPLWQKKRLAILEAAGFECSDCGEKEKTLHVHHLYYEKGKKPWEYPDDALMVLCKDCHKEEHSGREDFLRGLAIARNNLVVRNEDLSGYIKSRWILAQKGSVKFDGAVEVFEFCRIMSHYFTGLNEQSLYDATNGFKDRVSLGLLKFNFRKRKSLAYALEGLA